MTDKTNMTDKAKLDLKDALAKLEAIRDEVRVQLHLATLDVKKEWDEGLAPKLAELERRAKMGAGLRPLVDDLLERLEHFSAKLRHRPSPAGS